MSTFYINGQQQSINQYRFNSFSDPSVSELLLALIWERKKSNDRYIYSRYVESSKKPNKINEGTVRDPNINLINSSDITRAIAWKDYNS